VEAAKNTKNVAVSRKDFRVPGFLVSAVSCGMRYRERLDLALIAAESPAAAGGVFTTNRFAAAPVELCKRHLHSHKVKAILINAGIANACTGEEGILRAQQMAEVAAQALQVDPGHVLVASTGVIGQQIRIEPVAQAIPELCSNLREDSWADVARAIMTTDTVSKMASAQVELFGKTVTIGGVAKGSGMIAPNMATMLAFVCSDVAIQPNVLKHWLREGTEESFNRITVDGDTSTNDCVLMMAGGQAGNPLLEDTESSESRQFGAALAAVLLDLAKQIVYDGEGATKFVEIQVSGAPDLKSARSVAFTIAESPLVKTAFFGEDANWGRIVAAAGRAGVPIVPEWVALFFDDLCVFRAGMPMAGAEIEGRASAIFKQKEIKVKLDLGMGAFQFTVYTSDFSYDYVKINASYRT
jgi:glutamate N-acetyltransferase / amino-acid N-acetyltransferase